jgi:hypothetical protein
MRYARADLDLNRQAIAQVEPRVSEPLADGGEVDRPKPMGKPMRQVA